jgi:hypothetical protein
VDVAGARALTQRIAEGKPIEDVQPDLPELDLPFRQSRSKPDSPEPPEIEVVAIRPRALPKNRRPWVYVRSSGGRLRRAR